MPHKNPEERNRYNREKYRKNREAFFKDKKCAFCGSVELLELDHIDKELKKSHKIWLWSEERRLKEIEKCRILCRECHRKRSAIQHTKPITHGTKYCYQKHGCRCVLCSQAMSDYRYNRLAIS